MEAMRSFAARQRDDWIKRTFDDGGFPDRNLLIELRTRADAYLAIPDTHFEEWIAAHGTDPEPR
jgi:hypothetical protein